MTGHAIINLSASKEVWCESVCHAAAAARNINEDKTFG